MLQGRSPTELIPMNYDIVSFARSVMAADARKLLMGASFPPELRLQVMKAGVPYNAICKLLLYGEMKTTADLRHESQKSILAPPRGYLWFHIDPWTDKETVNLVKDTVERAFLETTIFKLGINYMWSVFKDGDWMSSLSLLCETIGPQIHYLDLNPAVQARLSLHRYDDPFVFDVTWSRALITCMDMLNLHFSKLKSCVLTLDICFSSLVAREAPLQSFDQTVLQWTTSAITDDKINRFETKLAAEVASLFDAFVAKGPGKSQFVRIRYFPGTSDPVDTYEPVDYGPLIKVERGKMAAESKKGSFGTQLLKDAYRLARSGQGQQSTITD